jgi:hypothetical protein
VNVEQARSIDLEAFLGQLGHEPVAGRGRAHEAWFRSPLRSEKTPSFKVDRRTNKWKDFGAGLPMGDIIDFVRHYAERQGWGIWDISQALKELDRLAGGLYVPPSPSYTPKPTKPPAPEPPRYLIQDVHRIRSGKLIQYLRSRRIPAYLAKTYLEEVHYLDTKLEKRLFGLGWKTESGGYEMRTRFFKTSIGPKAISVVQVRQEARPGTAIFEGMMDFLSYLQLSRNQPVARAVILNSTSMYRAAIAYCQAHPGEGPLLGFLQNDRPGLETVVKLKEALPQLEVQNHKYFAYGDVNDYLLGKKLAGEAQEVVAKLIWERFARTG